VNRNNESILNNQKKLTLYPVLLEIKQYLANSLCWFLVKPFGAQAGMKTGLPNQLMFHTALKARESKRITIITIET
jgi:hypothetical protein